jgi:hypothetical protein
MKKVILIVLVLLAGYQAWRFISSRTAGLEPLYTEPYIVVYGRDSCGLTLKFMQALDKESIYYIYKNIDIENVRRELHPRMEKVGLNTSYYPLPVVDVNSRIFARPEVKTVLRQYKKLRGGVYNASLAKESFGGRGLGVSGIIMGQEPMAIVDGEPLKAGDKLNDYEVLEVKDDSIRLRSPSGEVIVKELK